MNPDELRKRANYLRSRDDVGDEVEADFLDATADAWEASEARWLRYVDADHVVIADLRKRLEAAEIERRRMLEWISQAGHIPGCCDNWLIPSPPGPCRCGKDDWCAKLAALAKEEK